MDFYKNPKKLHLIRIILLVGFLILLCFNIYNILINKSNSYLGLFANGLMAVSMLLQIRKHNKEKNIDDL